MGVVFLAALLPTAVEAKPKKKVKANLKQPGQSLILSSGQLAAVKKLKGKAATLAVPAKVAAKLKRLVPKAKGPLKMRVHPRHIKGGKVRLVPAFPTGGQPVPPGLFVSVPDVTFTGDCMGQEMTIIQALADLEAAMLEQPNRLAECARKHFVPYLFAMPEYYLQSVLQVFPSQVTCEPRDTFYVFYSLNSSSNIKVGGSFPAGVAGKAVLQEKIFKAITAAPHGFSLYGPISVALIDAAKARLEGRKCGGDRKRLSTDEVALFPVGDLRQDSRLPEKPQRLSCGSRGWMVGLQLKEAKDHEGKRYLSGLRLLCGQPLKVSHFKAADGWRNVTCPAGTLVQGLAGAYWGYGALSSNRTSTNYRNFSVSKLQRLGLVCRKSLVSQGDVVRVEAFNAGTSNVPFERICPRHMAIKYLNIRAAPASSSKKKDKLFGVECVRVHEDNSKLQPLEELSLLGKDKHATWRIHASRDTCTGRGVLSGLFLNATCKNLDYPEPCGGMDKITRLVGKCRATSRLAGQAQIKLGTEHLVQMAGVMAPDFMPHKQLIQNSRKFRCPNDMAMVGISARQADVPDGLFDFKLYCAKVSAWKSGVANVASQDMAEVATNPSSESNKPRDVRMCGKGAFIIGFRAWSSSRSEGNYSKPGIHGLKPICRKLQ